MGRVLTSSHHEPGGSQQHPPPTTKMCVGWGATSGYQADSYQGEVLWLLQPQLPFMYSSCFDFPWPPVVNCFAADVESCVIVPLLLCKTRHAVGPRVEVSIVSIVGWSMQAPTSTSRTSAAAHEVAIGILTLGLGIRVTPVLRLLVYLSLVGCGQKRAYR